MHEQQLRVVAVAAPDKPAGALSDRSLGSADPASLYNACRLGALAAAEKRGAWGESNWRGTRADRRSSVLLMSTARGDMPRFTALLERVRPNLLLVGAMTASFRGAIACAEKAKEMLGDHVCVVLGGRHATESVYAANGVVAHHRSSPLRLMAERRIPRSFDLVVSGDGEDVVRVLGEAVAAAARGHRAPGRLAGFEEHLSHAAGEWIVGSCQDGAIRTMQGALPLDPEVLPAPAEMFGIHTSFSNFGGRPTAHVFSDVGRGCAFDCRFCSERASVTGRLRNPSGAAGRLFRQLAAAARVVEEDHPGQLASAFCEDSTLMGGSGRNLLKLAGLLDKASFHIAFGGQMTVDQVLRRGQELRALRRAGLEYVLFGLETEEPGRVGGIHKDICSGENWLARAERAIEALAVMRFDVGVTVLFGLGESHRSRLRLIRQLARWRREYGRPDPISFNWATQHPLRGADGGMAYAYDDWSVPEGPFTEPFSAFGEATVRYPAAGVAPPVLEEVLEVVHASNELYEQAPAAARRDRKHVAEAKSAEVTRS